MTSADVPLALADAGPDSSEPSSYSATFASANVAPDVADEPLALRDSAIDWVGMQGIDMPILFDAGDGNLQRCHAKVDAFVNLVRPDRRGIHMSRLYLSANQRLSEEPIEAAMLESLLRTFLRSHHGLADRARIVIHFEYLVRRKALRSNHHGWRAYPVCIEAALIGDAFHLELGTQVVYSSTCPASAALSRQLVQRQFAANFPAGHPMNHAAVLAWLGSERGMVATPHAQRSVARVQVRFADGVPLGLAALLDRLEGSLGTAVQTAVKREDEQAFALANGENPMFCEDAARRIRRALDDDREIAAFHVRVEHQESLHPHDAVAEVRRDFPGSAPCSATDHGSFV
ncbi:MAG TPA: GTP cyclohydrolase FolE2 [Rhodanobacteraceae bacterium]|nr:GTP cyclohydrolase FolE2 [Rhodanobacteraceae bacterium]